MALDPQTIYSMLGRLIAETPDFSGNEPITAEQNAWLGKAYALVVEAGDPIDKAAIAVNSQGMGSVLRQQNAQAISVILNRTLATAELNVPTSAQGAFIAAGNQFDAFAAIGKVLKTATSDVLIVDPYMDENVLSDFAVMVSEGILVRLLADEGAYKPGLRPAVTKWASQFGKSRPLETRLTSPRMLHDRLVIIDGKSVYTLTQSLNAFAKRSPGSVVRVDPETGMLKINAYASLWGQANPLIAP